MKLELSYDPAVDAWTLTHTDAHIRSLADVREWERQLRALLDPHSERIYLLVDLTNFSLAPEMGPEYGTVVKNYTLSKVHAIVRYGSSPGMTQESIQLQATINRFPANIMPDRAAASSLLEQIRNLQT